MSLSDFAPEIRTTQAVDPIATGDPCEIPDFRTAWERLLSGRMSRRLNGVVGRIATADLIALLVVEPHLTPTSQNGFGRKTDVLV